MGSCVSLHKGSDSAMKLNLSIEPKDENLLIPSPVKDKPETVNVGDRTIADVAVKSQWSPPRFRDAGSKDEAFFDSQPWLDSDCEDDFLSVNGEFSASSTPVHHSFSLGTLKTEKPPVSEETLSEPSPSKKRLSELFKESLRGDHEVDGDNSRSDKNEGHEKSANGTPNLSVSGFNGEKTPNGMFKSGKYAQCCLPRLLSNRSFNERKSRMSPAHSVG